MALPFNLATNYKIVDASAGCVTTNGGFTCDYISMKMAHKVWIVCSFTQAVGHATVVQPQRATAVAPTGAVSITVAQNIWSNLTTAVSDTLVKRTAATSYALAANVAKMQVVFEIDPSVIIAAGETFDVLGCTISNSAQANNFASVLYIVETRYPQATPPVAITD